MLPIRRILFPTDYSETADRAFAWALRFADAHDAELHALYAHVPGDDINCPTDPESEAWLRRRSARVVQAEREGTSVSDVIFAHADDIDADLIVMGTHGRTGLEHALLGSVAEKVVRRALCPVLTVPPRADLDGIERILVPVDFSKHGRAALQHAAVLAHLFGAHLDVLHVVQSASPPSTFGMGAGTSLAPALVERSQKAIEEVTAEIVGADVEWETHTEMGYAAADIIRFAESSGADLIVMATHGRTGLRHVLLGSVTEKVVRHACCPVFRLHSFGRSLIEAQG